jgi:hypothetical protein
MPNKNESNSILSIGERILEALTRYEVSLLIDVLVDTLSSEQRSTALAKLPEDTEETIHQILLPNKTQEQGKTTKAEPVSLAKLAQSWYELWKEWNEIISEASEEEGEYIAQEQDWEQPYFDSYTFVTDLEKVAEQMQPLVKTAFENGFTPDKGFASVLLEAENGISDSIPDWMDIDNGIYIEEHTTTCLLEWEWLVGKKEKQDGFYFAQRIREWEEKFSYVCLNHNAVLDFLLQLPDADKECILAGMSAHKETALWKVLLEDVHSNWHQFYIEAIHQYAPERYLDNLRATIPQQWQNGLPVIEDSLAQQKYQESLTAIEDTVDSLLQSKRCDSWTPESSLLFVVVGGFYRSDEEHANEKTLLRYYQQTAQGLGQSERVNALEIQYIAFEHGFDWSNMFKAFTEIPVLDDTRKTLFQSWRDSLLLRTLPYSDFGLFAEDETAKTWWLHWLLDSIATPEKGCSWFQQQILRWLTNLPTEERQLGKEIDCLRLLTKDLTEIYYPEQPPLPKFYQIVIQPKYLTSPDETFRREYLQQYAPNDLWVMVMAYWKANLHNFIPKPEMAHKSNYNNHAQWMAALNEIAPQSYQKLLSQWRVEHQRRRNLWKAMESLGLG